MRIAFLIRAMTFGGAQRQLIALASSLSRRGHAVQVVAFYGGGPLSAECAANGVELVSLQKRSRWDMLSFAWRLARHLRRDRPDVLHGYLRLANVMSVLVKPLLPRTAVVWGVRASDIDLSRYDWARAAVFHCERLLARFARCILANSESGKRFLVEHGYPAGKIEVVHNGIDTERFRPDADARRRVRAQWGVAADAALVGMVARFDPKKNHLGFLAAAQQVLLKRNNVSLVCIGDGPAHYREQIKAQAGRYCPEGRVVWAGPREDMPAVYNALDLVCLPSSFGEGFPNVVGEAMSCGVPCVVNDTGDSAAVVGALGCVVPPGDVNALADGIDRMLQLCGAADLKAQCRERIRQHFSVAAMVARTEHLLRRAAAQ